MKTITVETSQLSGAALDWAVAKAVGLSVTEDCGQFVAEEGTIYLGRVGREYSPSTNWSQGGPLIEQYVFRMEQVGTHDWIECLPRPRNAQWLHDKGPTPLIAAMRAIVAAELGDDVEVPAELMEASDA